MITVRISELIAGIIHKIMHNLWLYIHNIKYNVIISNGIMMKQNCKTILNTLNDSTPHI